MSLLSKIREIFRKKYVPTANLMEFQRIFDQIEEYGNDISALASTGNSDNVLDRIFRASHTDAAIDIYAMNLASEGHAHKTVYGFNNVGHYASLIDLLRERFNKVNSQAHELYGNLGFRRAAA